MSIVQRNRPSQFTVFFSRGLAPRTAGGARLSCVRATMHPRERAAPRRGAGGAARAAAGLGCGGGILH